MKKLLRFVFLAALLVPLGARAQDGWCTPNPTSIDNSGVTYVSFGNGTAMVNDIPTWSSPYYLDHSAMVGEVNAGLDCELTITFATGYSYGYVIWVDWNKDSVFSGNEVVCVGVAPSANPTTVTASFTVPATQDMDDYLMRICAADSYFDSYTGSIADAANADPCATYTYGLGIDYTLRVSEPASCFRVQSITASDITSDEMTVSWIDTTNDNTTYTLYFWAEGGTDTIEENGVSGNSYTFTDLEGGTMYYFSVVPDCSDGSVAPRIGSAATEISCEEGMCNITINMIDAYGDGWNGNVINVYQGSALMGSATLTSGSNGVESIPVCSGNPVSLTLTAGSWASEMGGSVTDGGGNTVFTIENMDSYSNGAVLFTIANPCPECLAPMALDTVMNEDGEIVLTWESRATGFFVYDNGVLVADDVSDTFYVFTGLSAASTHALGVSAACDDDEMSGISTLSITTPCGTITSMPWSTSFESDVETYVDPNCWTVPNHSENYGTYYPYVYGYTSHSGSRCVYFSTSYEEDTNLIVSSPIAFAANNLHVKYWIYYYLSDGTFDVGLMTDPYDASTFVTFKTLTSDSPEYSSYQYNQFEFFTDSFTAEEEDTVYLAFRLSGGYGYVYLDDIEMNSIPTCRMPSVGSGIVSNISYESADFTWEGNSENGYDLKLVRTIYDDTTGAFAGTVESHIFADSNFITVDTLIANTEYTAYVATICEGDEGTDTTDYLLIGQFQTQMRCYPVSNLMIATVTSSAASLTWNYPDNMGIASTDAILTLTDMTDQNVEPTVTVVEGASNYTYTGLVNGHTYNVTINSLCGDEGDTAIERTVFFTTHTPNCTQYLTEEQANTYGSGCPIYSSDYSPYSYSQTIYEGDLLDGLDTLTGVSYNAYWYNQSNVGVNTYTVDIYLGVVDTSALSPFSGQFYLNNAIPVDSSMVQVAHNRTFSVTHNGWFYIPFDAAWAVPAVDNGKRLLVTVVAHTDAVENTTNSWRAKSDYTYDANYNYFYKSRYYYSSTPFDPTESGIYTYSNSYVANLQFHGNCNSGCIAPSASVATTTGNSIDLNIFANGTESSWQVEYKLPEDTVWTVAGTATASPYTINGLSSGIGYQIRVGANCTDTMVYCSPFTVYTECAAIMPPYSVTFTSANPCWTSNLSSPGTYGYNIYSTYYLVSPEMGAPLDTLAITITGRAYSSGSSTGLQIMACDADGSNAVAIDTINLLYNGGVMMDYTIYLMDYNGTQNYFKLINADGGDVYVQAVSINYLPACMPVSNVTMDSNSATSISLSWTVNSPNAGFTVNYREEGSNSWSNINVSTNNATITGLNASTNYEVQVITNCTDSTTMFSSITTFATECIPQGIPYSQTLFTSMPACWSNETTGHPSLTWAEGIALGYGYAYSYASGSSTLANDWLITPQFLIPATITAADSIMIVYQIAGESDSWTTSSIAAYELLVDPTGGNNFTDTITIDTVNSAVFSFRRFPVAQYAGNTIRIAFRSTCKSSGAVAMYDFGVRSILNPLYYIQGVTSAFVGDANNFKAIRVEGETEGISFTWSSTMATAGQATMAYDNTDSLTITYTAAGLDTITLVATNAHGSDTSRTTVRVFALDPVTMFPYTTGFESTDNDNYSWITYNGGNAWILGTAADDSDNQSMIVSNDNATNVYDGTTSTVSWAYRAFQIADTGEYSISFDWKCNGEGNYDYLRVWLIPDSNFNIAANVIPGGITSMYDLYDADIEGWMAIGGKLNQSTTWTNQIDTVNINTPGRYYLAFMWGNDGSVMNQPPAAFDNVIVSNGTVSCPMPTVSSIIPGEDNLEINFTSVTDSVEIIVSEGQFNPDATGIVVSGNNYTATGLTYSTAYAIAMRSICAEGVYSDWTIVTDSTLMISCGVPTGLAVTATSYNSVSLSWNAAGDEQAWQVNLSNTTTDTTVTVNTTSATISGLTPGTSFNATVRALCGMNNDIEGDWSTTLVVNTDACQTTTGVTVNPGSTTANVTWNDMGSSSYRVIWGLLPFNPQDLAGEATVTTTSYTITGLDQEEDYAVVVYNNCAAGLSVPSATVNFSTIAGGQDPTMYTITVTSNNNAWGTVTGSGTYAEGTTVTITATANEGYHFERWNDFDTNASRTITVTGDATYMANFAEDGTVLTYYTVTATSNNNAWGSVNGGGSYAEGTTVTLTATPSNGYHFVQWVDASQNVLSTANPYTFTATADITVTAVFEADAQGIDDVTAGTMSLYPNPASTSVTLGLEGFEGEVSVDVVDMNGRVIANYEVRNSKLEINVVDMAPGAYFVRVTSGMQTAVRKLVVK